MTQADATIEMQFAIPACSGTLTIAEIIHGSFFKGRVISFFDKRDPILKEESERTPGTHVHLMLIEKSGSFSTITDGISEEKALTLDQVISFLTNHSDWFLEHPYARILFLCRTKKGTMYGMHVYSYERYESRVLLRASIFPTLRDFTFHVEHTVSDARHFLCCV